MHGRRSLKHNLLTGLRETQEIQLQLAEDKKETNRVRMQGIMAEEGRDGKGQEGPTLKELSAPSDYNDFTRITAPLNDNVNFKIDATMLNFLPSFHGRFSDEPYEFLREFTQFCSSYYFPGISQEAVKLMLFPFAIKDRARDWFNGTSKTFTTWNEVQTSFLQKYFSYGRTHALRKLIRDFTQGNETFGEAWERFMTLTRKCPHHGIPEHELAQIFYQGLDYQERQLVDISSGGNFLNTRANESLKKMEELIEDWVFRQSSMIDVRTGGVKRGVIDVKGMETDVRMERLEKEMKQSLLEVTENFKHLLKDAIATINPEANVSRVNVTSTCGNCVANDHIQDQCKVIPVEQVNAFGQQPSHGNWQVGANLNKMTNFGHNNAHQGYGMQGNQFKTQGQPNMHQIQPQYHHNPPFQTGQAQFHPQAPNMQSMAPNFTNHTINQNLWETIRRLQEKEKTWEEERKLLLTHIEMMKSAQGLGTFSREDKNKGKAEEACGKGGQFPTKPCINPCNFSFNNNNAKVFSYESLSVPSHSDKVGKNLLIEGTSFNAGTSLRSGKVLPRIVLPKDSKTDVRIGNTEIGDKTSELENIPELEEVNEKGKEQIIPFPNAFTRKKRT